MMKIRDAIITVRADNTSVIGQVIVCRHCSCDSFHKFMVADHITFNARRDHSQAMPILLVEITVGSHKAGRALPPKIPLRR